MTFRLPFLVSALLFVLPFTKAATISVTLTSEDASDFTLTDNTITYFTTATCCVLPGCWCIGFQTIFPQCESFSNELEATVSGDTYEFNPNECGGWCSAEFSYASIPIESSLGGITYPGIVEVEGDTCGDPVLSNSVTCRRINPGTDDIAPYISCDPERVSFGNYAEASDDVYEITVTLVEEISTE